MKQVIFLTTRVVTLVATLTVSNTVTADTSDQEGEWLAVPEYQGSIGASIGFDEDRSIHGLDLEWVLPYYSTLLIKWFESEYNDEQEFEFTNYFIEFGSDPLSTWSMAIAYEYNGDDQAIEIEDVTVSVQYYPNNWQINAEAIFGEITSYIRPELRNRSRISTTSATLDKSGYGLGVAYYANDWGWQLNGQRFHYENDITQLRTRTRLQRLFSQQTLSQIFSLINWQLNSSASYDWEKSALQVGITHYQLAVDNEKGTNLYGGFDYQLTDSLNLSAVLAESLDDSLLYTELSAKYQW